MSFLKNIFCFHPSWAKAAWEIYSPMSGDNWYICKDCGKEKNFGFREYCFAALPNYPVNFDDIYETYYFKEQTK